jgi:hypothetical protein
MGLWHVLCTGSDKLQLAYIPWAGLWDDGRQWLIHTGQSVFTYAQAAHGKEYVQGSASVLDVASGTLNRRIHTQHETLSTPCNQGPRGILTGPQTYPRANPCAYLHDSGGTSEDPLWSRRDKTTGEHPGNEETMSKLDYLIARKVFRANRAAGEIHAYAMVAMCCGDYVAAQLRFIQQ